MLKIKQNKKVKGLSCKGVFREVCFKNTSFKS